MQIKTIAPPDELWDKVGMFAEKCSWRAGKSLAEKMRGRSFSGWERVIVCFEGADIYGYCTVTREDCIPNVPYTPYIGYLFVDEGHRGDRISQKMISFAMGYLRSAGFDRVYLVSDHVGLYEKYGFTVIDRKPAPWGETEKIYMKTL